MFKGILIEGSRGDQKVSLTSIEESELPEGDVTVDIAFSTLNYKDALAITGKSPIVKQYPMIPGIDFAGTVSSSTHADFKAGDPVVLNGWGVGEKHWGGLAEKARVSGDWLIPLPKAFSPRQAMAIGTAGYTAMLCVMALEKNGVTPDSGDILVTGATGGRWKHRGGAAGQAGLFRDRGDRPIRRSRLSEVVGGRKHPRSR